MEFAEYIIGDALILVPALWIVGALIKHAFAKVRVNHDFNKTQLDWLKRIEKVLLEESVLDEQIFEVGAFKNAGGFTIIDRRFGGKLREIITELNEYLYEDGGSVA